VTFFGALPGAGAIVLSIFTLAACSGTVSRDASGSSAAGAGGSGGSGATTSIGGGCNGFRDCPISGGFVVCENGTVDTPHSACLERMCVYTSACTMGNAATCAGEQQLAQQALTSAQVCSPDAANVCQTVVKTACGCDVPVAHDETSDATAYYLQVLSSLTAENCPIVCPRIACTAVTSSSCHVDANGNGLCGVP
jgi:hypothetical protein